MSQYKVYQWATGVVGKSALRGVLRHPKLELAGVKVYSEEKEGLDAGAIVGAEDTHGIRPKFVRRPARILKRVV